MKQKEFLQQLREQTSSIMNVVQDEILHLSSEKLNTKPSPGAWSVFQCFSHVNLYNRYYLQALTRALDVIGSDELVEKFEYTWIGKKSVHMMRPSNAKKQKTFKKMIPSENNLTIDVIYEFLDDQRKLLALIDQAQRVNMNKKTIAVEFFRLLKMNIGETLEFVVVHEQRHLQQMKNVLVAIASTPASPVLAL